MAENGTSSMASLATKWQLRLSGGAMSLNPDEVKALEQFVGTDQMLDLTIKGTVSGAGIANGVYTITFLTADHMVDAEELNAAAEALEPAEV